jgi:hypothetical protein
LRWQIYIRFLISQTFFEDFSEKFK